MMDTRPAGPIEVWLSQPNLTITCTVVYENETTDTLDIDSLSLRGAQREITGHLIREGYTPVGRWIAEDTGGNEPRETSRKFTLVKTGS